MSDITIYHNPRCSKSRTTLALLQDKVADVQIVKYLETPPTVEKISQLITLLGFTSARQLMRTGEDIYKTLNLKQEINETALIEAMATHPKLIERPIVLANGTAVIGRPPESVLTIL